MKHYYPVFKLVYLSIAGLLFNLPILYSQSNVGIGTTTPSMTLDIEGNRAVEGIHINNTNAGNGNPIIQFQLGGTTQYSMGVNDADPNDNFIIGTTDLSTTRLSINNNGNVGIGAPGGIQKLHVQCNDASNGIVIENLNGADGDPTLRFDLDGPTQAFTLGVDDSDADKFKISGGAALGTNDRLVIQADGNIGIGAANPAMKFHVLTAGASGGIGVANNDAGDGDPVITYSLGAGPTFTMGVDDSDADIFKISAGGSLGTNDRLTINSNGNLGVGMPNAVKRLAVSTTGANDGIAVINTDGTNGDPVIAFELEGPTSAFILGVDDSDGDKFKISGGGALGTNDRLVINSFGAVGIGFSDPGAKLTIGVGGPSDGIIIDNTDGGDGDPIIGFGMAGPPMYTMGVDDSDGDKFKISANNGLGVNDRIIIDGTGKVGINNASPVSQLDVNGSFGAAIKVKTANYTLDATDYCIAADANGGAITLTLPAVNTCKGRIYVIKKIDSSGNTITIDGNASETIDGATTQTLSAQYQKIVIMSDNVNWFIIN